MSILLVDESAVFGENHQLSACHWQTSSDKVVSSTANNAASARHTNLNDDMNQLHTYI